MRKRVILGGIIGAAVAARLAVRFSRRIDLAGRVALVTGGSRGLGLVLARELLKEGCRVAICARDPLELGRACEELGSEVASFACDVADPPRVAGMIEQVIARFGQIDILINNAGVIEVGPLDTMTREDFEETMRTHFWGAVNTTLALLPHMRSRGEGRIVNISSIGGKISPPHLLPYNASKFALTGFSEGLRAELAKENILVTTVCPGLMRTGSPRNATFKGQHRAEYAWFAISDSLPIITISARRAARRIISAMRHGDAEVMLSLTARLASTVHGIFPGYTAEVMGVVNRFLPTPGGIGTNRALGKESESRFAPSVLTTLTQRAAAQNNEFP
jgi:NAD(P)-dependent dehydrogenase (short-subunit alcohol dehydrogenase family)